jgi:UDP-N-acetylmuramoyl-tripeptide--D-alanyl-D-alanine ligase
VDADSRSKNRDANDPRYRSSTFLGIPSRVIRLVKTRIRRLVGRQAEVPSYGFPDPRHNQVLAFQASLRRKTPKHVHFIAVTGSCGKSTAIAVAYAILSTTGKWFKNAGLRQTRAPHLTKGAETMPAFCIEEIHAGHPGMIAESVRILKPQIGVITTIGGDHYDCYRGLEATAREKGHLVESLPPDGVAILNIDSPHIAEMTQRTRARLITFGRTREADLRALHIVSSAWPDRLSVEVAYRGEIVLVETKLVGEHWIPSVLAGIAIGLVSGVDLKTCAEIVKSVEPVFSRCSVHSRPDDAAYVLDAFKAPYWTIAEGLAFVKNARASRKTIFFGTISDYPGAASPRYRRVARDALEVADRVVFVGPHAAHIDKLLRQGVGKDRLFGFQTAYQASAFLGGNEIAGELIYIKGSVVDHLERIMLARLDEVVCWKERCGRKRSCADCSKYRIAASPPFGLAHSDGSAPRVSV